jgi:hypothetical protein
VLHEDSPKKGVLEGEIPPRVRGGISQKKGCVT